MFTKLKTLLFGKRQNRSSTSDMPVSDNSYVVNEQVSTQEAVETEAQEQNMTEPKRDTLALLFKTDLENVRLDGDFGVAFKRMEETQENLIITGKAGTGKSTLLKYFLVHTKKQAVALAPTGVAALNIMGDTIHSFFKFPPRILTENDTDKVVFDDKYSLLDTLILDEFSMINANVLDAIDRFLRVNGRDSNKPFGGIQLILFGDLFQLPPVVTEHEESLYFSYEYGCPWFFAAKVFFDPLWNYDIIELSKNFRQKNIEFGSILDAIRLGEQTPDQLNTINTRFNKVVEDSQTYPIILVPRNVQANEINNYHMSKLDSELFILEGIVQKEFPLKRFPTDKNLKLKVGAQVMFLVNDPDHRWANGTIGKVVTLTPKLIEVEVIERGLKFKYTVCPYTWTSYAYRYDPKDHRVQREKTGTFTQYPLKLAWAITIHKSQGLTFDSVTIDLGYGAFSEGQTYVALSRCRTLEGIRLNRRISSSDIKVDPNARRFYKEKVASRQPLTTSR